MKAPEFGILNVLILAELEDCKSLLATMRTNCTLLCDSMVQALEGIDGGFVPDVLCIDPRRASSAKLVKELLSRYPGLEFVVLSLPFSQYRGSGAVLQQQFAPPTVGDYDKPPCLTPRERTLSFK